MTVPYEVRLSEEQRGDSQATESQAPLAEGDVATLLDHTVTAILRAWHIRSSVETCNNEMETGKGWW